MSDAHLAPVRSRFGWERVGVLAVLVATAGFSASVALAVPMFGTADESAHFDYAYQVWRGMLPTFEGGLVIRPPFGSVPPVQWVSQHPPLFYLILAPVIGPLTDADHMLRAGFAARAVNIAITVAFVAAVMWASRKLAPGRPRLALTTGIVAGSSAWVTGVGGAVYNDILAALLCALLLGVTARSLRSEALTWRDTALIAALGSLGMLSRASVAIVLALCLAALVVRSALGPAPGRVRRVGRGLLQATIAGCVVLASALWFYLHLLETTGTLTGGNIEWFRARLGRVERPIPELVADPDAWWQLLRFFGHGRFGTFPVELMTTACLLLPVAVGLIFLRRLRTTMPADAVVGALAAALVLASLAQQFGYASGGGQLSPRYLLPVATVVFVLIAHGLTAVARARWLPTAVWLVVVNVQYLDWLREYVTAVPQARVAPILPGAAVAATALAIAAIVVAVIACDRLPAPRHRPAAANHGDLTGRVDR
ncbi:hypothetical protein EXU48_07705 [Occultella glacieicola]|uniref:Glycosyltransferase RgtA/B/C/D-like domain-containing protein n=1 Tax=Occultella glacieicola TaxID=2518684 RepID=A0ABY2E6A3_9MICO|nr:hypothetical protein [Occultella glacieicola]TDE96110.1 hypothetical protein EXU48_07705 [Occultella glacieicola]